MLACTLWQKSLSQRTWMWREIYKLVICEKNVSGALIVLYLGQNGRHKEAIVVVQSPSYVWLFVTTWTIAHQPSPSFTISQSLLKFFSIELVTLSHYLMLCCPLLLLPSISPSISVFSNESVLHIRWPKSQGCSFIGYYVLHYIQKNTVKWDEIWAETLRISSILLLLFTH